MRPTLLLALTLAAPLAAQERAPQPMASPHATVSQRIGITDVTIDYHRPAVKGREIWGSVVPWGQVWRCGANENTTFSVSHDVKVEGKRLPAGTYGLHMIPADGDWTIIFSNNSDAWGSFSYDQGEDALRVTTRPAGADHRERLTYEFDELTDSSATVHMRWEIVDVAFRITVDSPAIVMAEIENAYLRGLNRFRWEGWHNAAAYCLSQNANLEKGLAWSQQSVTMQPNFTNTWTYAALLDALGRSDEAADARTAAAKLGSENELNMAGYRMMNRQRIDDAIAIFELNVERFPESWNVYDSLGEALAVRGDTAEAISYYERALSMVDDPQQQQRIRGVLQTLGS